jgi:Tfp pilus assembly protein PilO
VKGRESIWKRRAGLLVLAGLFLLANLGFLLGSRSIREARKQALEARRASLTSEVAEREAEAKKLTDERNRLAQVVSVIDEFYGRRVGSRRATLAPIVEEIHSVMRKAGIAPRAISYATSSVPTLPLSEMEISFGFQSDYARFKRLLAAFEANPRWIVVREVSISRNAETPGEVQVRLGLATYFSTDEKPPLPPVVPPAPAAVTRKTVRSVQRTAER